MSTIVWVSVRGEAAGSNDLGFCANVHFSAIALLEFDAEFDAYSIE